MLIEALLLGAALFGLTFFLFRFFQLRSGYRAMSTVEQRYAEIEATTQSREKRDNRPIRRMRAALHSAGLGNDIFPLVCVALFAFLAIALVLRLVGVAAPVAAFGALPLAVAGSWMVNRVVHKRRVDAFNNQMVTLLELVAGQVRGGAGSERALQLVIPGLPEPLRGEMTSALASATAGGDLIEALGRLREKYPSRSFDMFLSALEIDRREGHSIAPALSQAANLMKDTLTLQSEGKAEIASTRWEFYAIFGILLGIAAYSVTNFGGGLWGTPLGVVILAVCFGNYLLGLFRFNRILARLHKETS